MKELDIKLTGGMHMDNTVVTANGAPVALKKNAHGNYSGRLETDKDTVKLEVARYLDIGGILWFLAQLFFFLISIFGIFDVHRKEKCITPDFAVEIDLKDSGNSVALRCNTQKADAKAIDVDTDLETRELSNVYRLDANAKRKLKLLLFSKIVLAAAVVAAVLFIIIAI